MLGLELHIYITVATASTKPAPGAANKSLQSYLSINFGVSVRGSGAQNLGGLAKIKY